MCPCPYAFYPRYQETSLLAHCAFQQAVIQLLMRLTELSNFFCLTCGSTQQPIDCILWCSCHDGGADFLSGDRALTMKDASAWPNLQHHQCSCQLLLGVWVGCFAESQRLMQGQGDMDGMEWSQPIRRPLWLLTALSNLVECLYLDGLMPMALIAMAYHEM